MSEKSIEQKLRIAVKLAGGIALKFVSPSLDGMPDRLVLLPNGKVGFVEVKATGKSPTALQLKRHEQLRRLGFLVFVLDNPEQIPHIIRTIGGSPNVNGV